MGLVGKVTVAMAPGCLLASALLGLLLWSGQAVGQSAQKPDTLAVCRAKVPKGFSEYKPESPTLLAYRIADGLPRVGRVFALDVFLCGSAAVQNVTLDVRMPAHGHGMNYRPTRTRVGPNVWRFSGLMLHMPGHWLATVRAASAHGSHTYGVSLEAR